MILAGDIGGTKTLFGLFMRKGSKLSLIKEQKYSSESWNTLECVLDDFLKGSGVTQNEIEACCLSLAGPIQDQICTLTNLGKIVDLERLNSYFHFLTPLTFCNDLVATGHGVSVLEPSDFSCLNPEQHDKRLKNGAFKDPYLNRAVIAPGTGLGESIIFGENKICPTEGAHSDFAPRSELEVRLWRFLHKKFGHVSYERVLSGPGLVNIYEFFVNEQNNEQKYPHSAQSSSLSSPYISLMPEEVSSKALSESCPLCIQALDLFVQILGAEAGNLALKSFALGGIYLGGGIPPKILKKLQEGSFMQSFQAKGRFQEFVASIPVYVILNEKAALYGAALRSIL